MRSLSLLIAVSTFVACEPNAANEKPTPSPAQEVVVANAEPVLETALKRDLDRICNAEDQSGALHEIPSARAQHVAVWLATSLESQDARDLSAELVALAPPERIARLRTVLAENEMGDCEILATW